MIRSRTASRTTAVAGALLLLALAGCGVSGPASTPEPPARGNVLDLADVLTPAEEQDLSSLIDEQNVSTESARVAVLLVENAGGSIEDYARDVATSWGVGDEDADNGVLVVADTEERELRIETADGVRERFSDDDAQQVIDDVLGPAFADEEYAEGLSEAVDQVYLYAEGREPVREPFDWALFAWVAGGGVIVVGGIIGWVLAVSRRRRREADREIRAAEELHPELRFTEEQRAAYRRYRYGHRGGDAISNPVIWLPLFIANPALYSGGGDSSASGSSYNGGGGFTGGGASGSY